MNSELRRRLEKMEAKFCPHEDKSGVVFIPLKSESDSELDERIERWYAGEEVEDQKKVYVGGNQRVMKVRFVKSGVKHAA